MRVKESGLVLITLAVILVAGTIGTVSAQVAVAAEKPISITLQDVPVRTAIDTLFREAGLNYAFEGSITGVVNVSLTDVPFDQALQVVLRSAGLTMRRENNTYMIGPKKDVQAVATMSNDLVSSDNTEIARSTSLEKIRINFADVNEIGAIFGAQYQGGMSGGMGGGYGGMGGGMGMMGGMGGGMMGGGMGGGMGGYGGGGYGGGGGMGGYGGGMGGMGGGMGGYGGGMSGGYGGGMGGGYGGGMTGGYGGGGGRRW